MVLRKYRECGICGQEKRTSVKYKDFICKRCRGFRKRLFSQISGTENYPYVLGDRDFLVLLCLEKGDLPINRISIRTRIPLSTLYKIISRLSGGGFIEKRGMICSLTKSTKQKILDLKGWDLDGLLIRNKKRARPCIRFHALQGKLSVSSPPRNYSNYLNKYVRIPVGRNKKETGFKLMISNCLIIFYSSTSISICFPDVLVNSLDEHRVAEGYCKIGLLIDSVIEKLERMFNGLKIDWFCPFGLDNQHIAIKDSKYARRYYEENKEFLDDGNLITDKSHGYYELEAVNPKTAGGDIMECLRLEKESRKSYQIIKKSVK